MEIRTRSDYRWKKVEANVSDKLQRRLSMDATEEASFKMDPKYPCPCGASDLTIKTTKKPGVNHNRKYLTCPSDCGFYSFLDELRLCKCRKGFCRNTFRKNVKYWCCPFKGTDASCGYFSEVVPLLPEPEPEPQPTTPCQPTPTTPRSASTPTAFDAVFAVLPLGVTDKFSFFS